MENIIKIRKGITYTQEPVKYSGYNCRECVANDNVELCAALDDEECSHSYVFKVGDFNNTEPSAPPEKAPEASQGVKYDDGKTLYSLVPPYALEAVAKNLTAGLKKYPARNNWMQVNNAEERYLDALYRHLEAHRRGEIYDTDNIDSTTTHLSAVAVNSLFLLELMLNPKLNKGENK
jgi:hypothetical protein